MQGITKSITDTIIKKYWNGHSGIRSDIKVTRQISASRLIATITQAECSSRLWYLSSFFAIWKISSFNWSSFCSISIISPHNNSFTFIPRIEQRSSIISKLGIALPVSHFDMALSVTFNSSANCACVRFLFFLHSAINFPILIWSRSDLLLL